MPCSGSSGGLSWMRPRGWRLGLVASPPAEMFYKGGQKGGSGVSAQRGTAQRREGGIREKNRHMEKLAPRFPSYACLLLTEHLARPHSAKGC